MGPKKQASLLHSLREKDPSSAEHFENLALVPDWVDIYYLFNGPCFVLWLWLLGHFSPGWLVHLIFLVVSYVFFSFVHHSRAQ